VAYSDVDVEKERERPNRRLADTHSRWSDQQKLDAAKSWLVLGNTTMVSRLHGIPRITLCKWQESQWWHDLIAELRSEERITLSNKMKNLVEAAQTVVANRLETGDAVLNQKTGEIIYKPVSMKDAHRVAVDMLNQKQVLDKASGAGGEIKEADTNKLEALAEKFAEFATKSIEQKLDKKRTIDGEGSFVEDVPFVERTRDNVTPKMAQNEAVSDFLLPDNGPDLSASLAEEEQERSSPD
jgi:hypothetical protein